MPQPPAKKLRRTKVNQIQDRVIAINSARSSYNDAFDLYLEHIAFGTSGKDEKNPSKEY